MLHSWPPRRGGPAQRASPGVRRTPPEATGPGDLPIGQGPLPDGQDWGRPTAEGRRACPGGLRVLAGSRGTCHWQKLCGGLLARRSGDGKRGRRGGIPSGGTWLVRIYSSAARKIPSVRFRSSRGAQSDSDPRGREVAAKAARLGRVLNTPRRPHSIRSTMNPIPYRRLDPSCAVRGWIASCLCWWPWSAAVSIGGSRCAPIRRARGCSSTITKSARPRSRTISSITAPAKSGWSRMAMKR